MHILCTICSDLVNQAENIHATKCGHIFHYHCLSQWIDRSKSCPQCRNKVTDRCMYRIYPTVSNENTGEDVATLQSRLDDALLQLRQQKALSKEKEVKLVTVHADLKKNEDLIKTFEKKLISRDSAVSALKEQLEYVKVQNKETQRLKEENETLKKNMQMLNGLQKVLNATSEEVEEMLQGYTDVKTVATFATALKRALCESESKKNELREKLHTAKQACASEKTNAQNLQTKIVQLEDKLIAAAERKCELRINKRKADQEVEVNDLIKNLQHESQHNILGETPPKQMKQYPKINDTILRNNSNTSFGTMVKTIENADSPYLSLKQSSLALTALQQRPAHMVPESKLKPSEFALLNSVRNAVSKNQPNENQTKPHSIFHTKPLPYIDRLQENPDLNVAMLDISYDGLGGHSKLDSFPVPKPQLKSCVPKLTAKHKLKRPSSGSQDISKMLGRMKDK